VTIDEPESTTSAVARFLTRVPLMLSRHLWVWPILGAVLLGIIGYWVKDRIEQSTRAELGSRLQTLLKADVAALHLWFSEEEADAKSFAGDVRFRDAIVSLAEMSKWSNATAADLANSEAAKTLQLYLKPLLEPQHYLDYVVLGADRRILASPHRLLVGRLAPPGYELFLDRGLRGQLSVSRPFARELTMSERAQGPTMFVAAPVRSTESNVVAVLALRMRPEEEFSKIFSVARMGDTGESYAFDRRGVMLTASRFDMELKELGLIPSDPEATSILNLRLIDPGVDLEKDTNAAKAFARLEAVGQTNGPGVRRGPRREDSEAGPPLTRMAISATKGENGHDVDGYRNYRGALVVGAWEWLPQFQMGVATEVAQEEAFDTLYMLRRLFLVLFTLLVISGVGIFAFTLAVGRLQASLRKSAVAARRLGQYVLMEEIGRGANGLVYRARHTMLRRPVAVKLLSPDLTNESNAARFEREVQMTSQLTHPNTVAIYDYGHTPEGLFYYAMEYLAGIDLDQLVRQFGLQPEARVIHILRQVCGSLAEAHGIGLIHRDIKPANVVLTRRAGVADLVKVLDFGLVKAVGPSGSDSKATRSIVGTPHFMSPEAIDKPASVDARSDIYSVGAVGYWLLAGKTLFDSDQVDALLVKQVKEQPLRPSERVSANASAELEEVIMRCLAKNPEDRPSTAEELERELGQCSAAGTWTRADAEQWWQVNAGSAMPAHEAALLEKTLVIAPR
jgi:tRNA A-37 threonylcarbamoyl transferase component Bud32